MTDQRLDLTGLLDREITRGIQDFEVFLSRVDGDIQNAREMLPALQQEQARREAECFRVARFRD